MSVVTASAPSSPVRAGARKRSRLLFKPLCAPLRPAYNPDADLNAIPPYRFEGPYGATIIDTGGAFTLITDTASGGAWPLGRRSRGLRVLVWTQ